MNGYNDIHTEPADDEEFALACGYEIITEDELYDYDYDIISLSRSRRSSSDSAAGPMPLPPLRPTFRHSGGKKLASKPSVSSFTSTSTDSSGVSSMIMSKPMSSCSLSSQSSDMTDDDCFSFPDNHHDHDDIGNDDDADHDYQMSVERIWSMIQQKRHHHHDDMDEGLRMSDPHHFLTMEHSSNNSRKLTAWFHNLVHFPEKLKQIVANKHRFNINKVPEEIRDELKHIYVY